MRVRLTKQTGSGTAIVDIDDKTAPLPVAGRLMVFSRQHEMRRRQAEEAGQPVPADAPLRSQDEIRRRGHLVFVAECDGSRMVSSTIEDVDPGPPICVWTRNSRYLIEVLRSTETPTDPRGRRR